MSPHVVNGINSHSTTNGFHNDDPLFSSHKPARDGFSTRAIHVGSEPSTETGAVIPPISLSTTYKQDQVGVHKGYEYTRSSNPNRAALERMLAALEDNGARALAFSSGSAATASVFQALGTGAHVLSINDVYGGTFRYMSKVASQLQGLEATFIDFEKASDQDVLSAIRENTKVTLPSYPIPICSPVPNRDHTACVD